MANHNVVIILLQNDNKLKADVGWLFIWHINFSGLYYVKVSLPIMVSGTKIYIHKHIKEVNILLFQIYFTNKCDPNRCNHFRLEWIWYQWQLERGFNTPPNFRTSASPLDVV